MEQEINQETIYDANAKQRFEFVVKENGAKYDTAHIYQPLSDERYVSYIKSLKVKGDEKNVDENSTELINDLWNELVSDVENLDKTGYEENWKDLIDFSEKQESLTNFLTVAPLEPEEKSEGQRSLVKTDNENVITEAFFNFPNVSRQTHVLKKKTDEWKKKYNRIQDKRWREEPTKGLRRKPKLEFVPQDEAIGGLYDEMFIEAKGFKDGVIPLRFKTAVIHFLFGGSKLDEKK